MRNRKQKSLLKQSNDAIPKILIQFLVFKSINYCCAQVVRVSYLCVDVGLSQQYMFHDYMIFRILKVSSIHKYLTLAFFPQQIISQYVEEHILLVFSSYPDTYY